MWLTRLHACMAEVYTLYGDHEKKKIIEAKRSGARVSSETINSKAPWHETKDSDPSLFGERLTS